MLVAGWAWLRSAHPAIAADVHARHRLDWYQLPAGDAYRLALLVLRTPGTYTHSTVALPEIHRRTRQPSGSSRTTPPDGPAARGYELADIGGEYHRSGQAPMDERWRRLAAMNGKTV